MPFALEDALLIEEGGEPEEAAKALQRAINGHMWSLPGSYGRAMSAAIAAGECMLGETACRDYWGNRVPSRDEVAPHTKGHRTFVVDRMGEAWAAMLDGVNDQA